MTNSKQVSSPNIVIKLGRMFVGPMIAAGRRLCHRAQIFEEKFNMRMTSIAAALALGGLAVLGTARAGAVEEAMQADRDFAKMAQTNGVAEAFAAFVMDEGVLLVPGPEPVRGRAALKALMEKSFADGGKLEWEPKEGLASGDGRMAMTWGRSVYTSAKDASGTSVVRHGNYLTVWHKQRDGSWKFSYDIGNRDPVPAP